MEKINLVELLKDCPKGMELYSPLCGECRVLNIYDGLGFDVICGDDTVYNFSYDGRYNIMGECCIFPSKENRDWSKFQRPFEDGDILFSGLGGCDNPFIFKQINGWGNAQCYCAINCYKELILNSDNWTPIKWCRFATEEEKEKLFKAIKDNGYVWNPRTKTMEKLPKFKVGDRIKKKDIDDAYAVEIAKIIQSIYSFTNGNWQSVESVDRDYELVTETKFKVGDSIRKRGDYIAGTVVEIDKDYYYKVEYNEGSVSYVNIESQNDWELAPSKFDINTLIPFESRVLMRSSNAREWVGTIYSHYNNNKFYGCGMCCDQCIPYEGNEHLLGKTDDCDEFYKNW